MKSRYSLKILNSLIAAAVVALAITPHAASPKFYADDPVNVDVDDQDASGVRTIDIDHTSYGWRMFHGAGDHSTRRATNVNTLGEVPNSSWYTNRIGLLPLSPADIARGPDSLAAPPHGPWTVVGGKIDGVTPGLRLKDAAGRLFFCKFDPPGNPEMASGAEVVATKLLFALGYWVPENY